MNDHSPIGRMRARLEDCYLRVDLRWLGVFRVLFGVLLCVDLLRRWAAATDFYTNDGVLPNHFSLFRPLGRNVFSLYHAFSTLPQVNVAFALTLVVFVAFTLGYRTRLFHALSLLCITSLNARNLMVENGGTVVVNLLCFWTLFLPLGERLSIDSLLRWLRSSDPASAAALSEPAPEDDVRHHHYSLATLALVLQWSVIYFFNVVHKSGQGWRDGSALHWFLHQDRIVTWFGIFAREHAPYVVLRAFTYATLVVEGALAGLLLLPFRQVWCRRLALLFAVGLHGGIAATSRLGPFSYAMTVFFVLLLGADDWKWLVRRFQGPVLRVVYDADCGLCFQLCRVLSRLDLGRRLRFIGNDEADRLPAGLGAALLEQTVAVVDERGNVFTHERAVSAVLTALPLWSLGLGILLRVPGLSFVARRAYQAVARRRHEISQRMGYGVCGARLAPAATATPAEPASAPHAAEPAYLWPRLLGSTRLQLREGLVVAAMVMIFIQILGDNAWARRRVARLEAALGVNLKLEQPAALLAVMDTLRLYQGWRMFAPEPPYEDGRLVVDGRTQDGRKVDPLTGAEPDFNPETTTGWGHDQLWCDYHLKMYFARYAAYRQHFKHYLERWHLRTGRPEDRLVAFDVWWVNDKSPPPGSLHGQPQKPIRLLSFGRVRDSGAEPWLVSGLGSDEP